MTEEEKATFDKLAKTLSDVRRAIFEQKLKIRAGGINTPLRYHAKLQELELQRDKLISERNELLVKLEN